MKMNKKLFYAMSRRRVSDPQITQQLWDAIKTIRYQRQVPDIDRIAKYMLKTYNVNHEEVVRQLGYCVRDGLLEQVKRMGFKGSKVGVEQEGYKLPQETMKKDRHDWYCFERHHGGDVISCDSCHRVYHLACIGKEELPETDVKHKFKCSVCKMCEERDQSFEIKKSQLNRLLRFTCNHLKQRMPGCITDRPTVPIVTPHITDRWASATPRRSASEVPNSFKFVSGDKDEWRKDYLIHRYMDLPMMQSKAESGKYEYLEEFKADAQTVVHNVVILHGVHSIKADEARLMLRDCLNDLQEIRQCRDCYRYSCDKTNRRWFCKPCRPPHTLVYAKQKGSAYWPAKVIKIDGDSYDVRFFGGQHEHVIVDKAYIRPISVNIHTLQSDAQVKKSSAWNKACEELKKHQKLLEKVRIVTNNFTLPAPESSSSSEDEDEEEVEEVNKKEVEAEAEDEKSQSCSEESSTRTSTLSTAKEKKKKNAKASKKPPSIADEEEASPSPKRKGRPKKSDVATPTPNDKIEQEESSVASEDVLVSAPEKEEKVTTPQELPSAQRKRGRPPGSKNKTPTKKILLEKKSGSQKSKKSSSAKSKKKASKGDDSRISSDDEEEEEDDEDGDDEEEEEEDEDGESSSKDANEDKEDLEPMELTEETKNDENAQDGEDEDNSKDELGPPQLQHGPSSKKESPISSTTLSPPHLVKKEEEEMVSSSSQEPQVRSVAVQAKISEKKSQEKPSKELISRIRAELDFEKQKEFERELEKVNNDHLVELNILREKHALQISDTKKKQWCYNCEAEAIYHCCWNTAYCSTECQQLHWQKEHKRVCRRKR
ncbi:hypothetical protein LSTR_LSTR004386 [Laodelphax striatellus]|uniref:MYND-type domain-containing protein n=1 Tax=Laodelphax striatellus TaxID=195883 RepID=A0A482X953_LAOST|nr:hypothetical protein LSTR_LSTR004386 [Laodelphax striatellus]